MYKAISLDLVHYFEPPPTSRIRRYLAMEFDCLVTFAQLFRLLSISNFRSLKKLFVTRILDGWSILPDALFIAYRIFTDPDLYLRYPAHLIGYSLWFFLF